MLLSYSFPISEVWVWLSWILHLRSHKVVIKVSDGLCSFLEISFGWSFFLELSSFLSLASFYSSKLTQWLVELSSLQL